MFRELFAEEIRLKSGDYLTNGVQKIIKPKMRFVLVDWMSQVCHDNCLMRETFYYSVYILDRFLSRTPLSDISELQLIGLTSLVLACKIEEVRPPSIYVMLTYCLNIYSDRDLRLCEIRIGKVKLDYRRQSIGHSGQLRCTLGSVC